ncbi:hypothetical protein F0562_008518 [Nyssa sinensis]|uniref:Uncharacterized protein n=1 Tax=Nyssa sinensis TaxID=561372 RepID=A0A5J5A7N1_9ASTE|nr:hypothetical protein F0562_008518 [Nyssa sinensis]
MRSDVMSGVASMSVSPYVLPGQPPNPAIQPYTPVPNGFPTVPPPPQGMILPPVAETPCSFSKGFSLSRRSGHSHRSATCRSGCRFVTEIIITVDRNYIAHAKELGNADHKEPVLFQKPTSSYLENGGAIKFHTPWNRSIMRWNLRLRSIKKLAMFLRPLPRTMLEATHLHWV